MERIAYYNGTIGTPESIMIPMNDRVCYFGDGVYDATAASNGHIFLLDEHVDRLFNSAGLVGIKIPYTKPELKAILNDVVSRVDNKHSFVYFQVTRGTAPRNHAFPEGVTETYIHPALECDELKGITNSWHRRVWEYKLFSDPKTKQHIDSLGIKLINYRDLAEMKK